MGWYNSDYEYRKKITISGETGAGTDYQIPINIGECSGASGYDFHIEGYSESFPSAKDQGGDFAVTSSDGTTELYFWVETVSGTSPNRTATIWVKVSADLGSNQDIYLYFGNSTSGVPNKSDANNTFIKFDDFDGGSLDTSIWQGDTGSFSVSGSSLICNVSNKSITFKTPSSFTDGAIETRCKGTHASSSRGDLVARRSTAGGNPHTNGDGYAVNWRVETNKDIRLMESPGDGLLASTAHTYPVDTWFRGNLKLDGSDLKARADDTEISASDSTVSSGYVGVAVPTNSGFEWDWVAVRKYVSVEPAFSSVGDLESLDPTITTQAATNIGTSTATLNCNFTIGQESSVEVWFSYALDESGASWITTTKRTKTANGSLAEDISSLTPGAIYKFKAHIQGTSSGASEFQGSELTFTLSLGTMNNGKKIRYYNNSLYICGGTTPAKIGEIDVSSGSPIWEIRDMDDSGESFNNAKDLVLNTTFNKIYVGCENGLVADVDMTDLTSRTEINVSDTDEIITIEALDDSKIVYMGTDSSTAELYMLDNRNTKKVSTDFRFGYWVKKKINAIMGVINGLKIPTDFRFGYQVKKKVNTDLRFSPYSYNTITAKKRTDFKLYIDGVQTNDVDLSSIIVRHIVDEQSEATFILARYYDKIDYQLDGTYSQISNNNNIKIYIGTKLIFEGNVNDIVAYAEGEKVQVSALSESEWTHNVTTINLPIPSLNEQAHLYHALVNNISIQDPKIQELTNPDDIATMGGTIKVTGLYNYGRKLFNDSSKFSPDVEGLDIDIVSGNDVRIGRYHIEKWINYNEIRLDKSPTWCLTPMTNGVGYISNNPKYYRGIMVDLGDWEYEEVNIQGMSLGLWRVFYESSYLADAIIEGNFIPDPNWEYFWFVAGAKITDTNIYTFNTRYIGTSMQPITYTIFNITQVEFLRQRIDNNQFLPVHRGYYVGTFPYQQISVKSGAYMPDDRYEDREDGLYWVFPEGYNYRSYARNVADLEYEKLKNINGNIFPQTNLNIDLTIDGWLYYGVKLLTKVNITNTTQSGIYKNNNGFPVSVKTIEINSGDMKVHLGVDNSKSQSELKNINDRYPDEPGTFWGFAFHIYDKFDLPNFQDAV